MIGGALINSSIEIKLFHQKDKDEWNNFVCSNPNATIFHTTGWMNVIKETFNFDPKYLVVKNSIGRIIAISPAFLVKTLFGKVIVSQPFFEYGGPLVDKGYENAHEEILEFYKNEVETNNLKYVELRISPQTINEEISRNFIDKGYLKQFKAYDFYLDLVGKDYEKDIWNGLYTKKSRIRNSVKKAINSGVRVVEDNDINVYYELYIKTLEKLGSPPYPKAFFRNIKKYIDSKYVRFTFAYLNGEPISALMSYPFNKRDLMIGLVSDETYQEYRANDLLYNEQIEYATKNKYDIIDFGRTRPNSSYERYKEKWGARKVDLYSYVYPPSENKNINPYKHYLTFSRITKRIPWIFTKTTIGPYLAKKFP
jgi:lipid II:glycine glycyltransferase (peptidoglycan interpeptide bridge formation enzyme)